MIIYSDKNLSWSYKWHEIIIRHYLKKQWDITVSTGNSTHLNVLKINSDEKYMKYEIDQDLTTDSNNITVKHEKYVIQIMKIKIYWYIYDDRFLHKCLISCGLKEPILIVCNFLSARKTLDFGADTYIKG